MSNNDCEQLLRELVEACEEEAASAKWPETKRARGALGERQAELARETKPGIDAGSGGAGGTN